MQLESPLVSTCIVQTAVFVLAAEPAVVLPNARRLHGANGTGGGSRGERPAGAVLVRVERVSGGVRRAHHRAHALVGVGLLSLPFLLLLVDELHV